MEFLFIVLAATILNANIAHADSIDLGPIDAYAIEGNISNFYVPLYRDDEVATANAKQIAEWSRSIFNTGIGPVPPLDPYTNKSPAKVVVNGDYIVGTISLSNLLKKGSKNFDLSGLEVRLSTERLDFVVNVPKIEVDVDFDAELKIDDLDLNTSGHLKMVAFNVTTKGDICLSAVSVESYYEVVGMHIHLISDDVKVDLTNLARSSDNVQKISQANIIKAIVENLKNEVALSILQTAKQQSNDVLEHFSVKQIMALLLPHGQYKKPKKA